MEGSRKCLKEVKVEVIEGTEESFKEYGQVIGPSPDGEEFGLHDAQLDLSRGTPRYIYIYLYLYWLGFVLFESGPTNCGMLSNQLV